MNIIKINDEEKMKIIYGLPDAGFINKPNVVLGWNSKKDHYVLLKCRYDLSKVDITRMNYLILTTPIQYNEINKTLNNIEKQNIIITSNLLRRKESIDILESI